MKTIDIKPFGSIISSKTVGDEIYLLIKNTLNNVNEITIDMAGIKSMATFCAKQIFGQLYIELGSEDFYNRVSIKNAADDVKTIIQIGIENALEENKQI